MDRPHPLEQRVIGGTSQTRRTRTPSIVTGGRHAEHARHGSDGEEGLVRAHELEDPDGITAVSRANQAAAFARISRSCRSCRFSRRRRVSSSRSLLVAPSCRWPSSRIGLTNLVPDRLRSRLELTRQLLWRPSRADQFDHLSSELRRIGCVTLRHWQHLLLKWKGVHQTGSTPTSLRRLCVRLVCILAETVMIRPRGQLHHESPHMGSPGPQIARCVVLVYSRLYRGVASHSRRPRRIDF
jgi:hypothetical protein